jgi:hypothetical protein
MVLTVKARCDCFRKGPKARAGFTPSATIDRHHFGVGWNSTLDRGGVVVGNMVEIMIDAESDSARRVIVHWFCRQTGDRSRYTNRELRLLPDS